MRRSRSSNAADRTDSAGFPANRAAASADAADRTAKRAVDSAADADDVTVERPTDDTDSVADRAESAGGAHRLCQRPF